MGTSGLPIDHDIINHITLSSVLSNTDASPCDSPITKMKFSHPFYPWQITKYPGLMASMLNITKHVGTSSKRI